MAKFYTELTPALRGFIAEQQVFFVATAPEAGRINLSPKGMDTFRVLDDHTVAYLDLTGSGNETSAHLTENGRITMMMCSFTAKPNIFRIYGRGRAVRPGDGEWAMLSTNFEVLPGTRQIFVVEIDSMQDSCGFAVPYYDYVGPRDQLLRWAEVKGEDGLKEYRNTKNRVSIDGLPTGLAGD